MKLLCLRSLSIVILGLAQATVLATQPVHSKTLAPTLKKVMPAVVHIAVQGNPFWLRSNIQSKQAPSSKTEPLHQHPKQQIGSGVILNAKEGTIVTNAHLVFKAHNIIVTLKDGRHFIGHLVGLDTATDLAVIRIKPNQLNSIVQAQHPVHVGDFVIAVGSPFGLTQSVTSGIVSGIQRHLGIEGIENFIQTDASINPGNSGGALVNQAGELIGINTAILSASGGNIGIGFAIPINIVQPITEQLLKYGNIKRGMLGIVAQTLTPSLAKALKTQHSEGALVNQIIPDSSAQQAGLKPEDLIIKMNQEPITNAPSIRSLAAVVRAGSTITLTLERQGKIMHQKLTLKTQADQTHRAIKLKPSQILKGLILQNLDRMVDGGEHIMGVEVLQAATGSVGWLAGLEPHDIILKINHAPTQDLKQLTQHIQKHRHNRYLFNILRGQNQLYLVLEA